MTLFFSVNPVVNAELLDIENTFSGVSFTYIDDLVYSRVDGLQPSPNTLVNNNLRPGQSFTNQTTNANPAYGKFIVRSSGKARGTVDCAFGRTGVGTEDIFSIDVKKSFYSVVAYSDINTNRIRIGNGTNENIAVTLIYGRAFTTPNPGGGGGGGNVIITNVDEVAEAIVQAIYDSYDRQNAAFPTETAIGNRVQRIVGIPLPAMLAFERILFTEEKNRTEDQANFLAEFKKKYLIGKKLEEVTEDVLRKRILIARENKKL